MPRYSAVTADRFANKAWRRRAGFGFAARAHVLPIVAGELPNVLPDLPTGFVRDGEAFRLVALAGLHPNVNVLVAPDGRWMGRYIPAVLRGFPFRLAKIADSDKSVLCVDEDSGLIVEAGQGEAFFDESGAPSRLLTETLEFLSYLERGRFATQAAVDLLRDAGLIEPWPLSRQQGGEVRRFEGMHRVNEAALNAMPDEAFLALRKGGALAMAYAQLLSMNQFAALANAADVHDELSGKVKSQQGGGPGNLEELVFDFDDDGGTLKFN